MKTILVLGAGYANLSFLNNLPHSLLKEYQFCLISQTHFHYESVLLHEVVSGSNSSVNFNLDLILDKQIKFIEDSVIEIKENLVIGKNNTYHYDALIIGLGFASDNFGIKGINEYAFPIVNYDSSLQLHQKIKQQVLAYKNGDPKALEFAICGGGFSGIELIASLAEELPKLCKTLGTDTKGIKLTCIEAMPNILPMFDEPLIHTAVKYLEALGIHLSVQSKILECKENGVLIQKNQQEEFIDSALNIWTAGVKGNAVIENSAFFTSVRSKIEVNHYLQPINQENQDKMENIFVIGDCSALKDPQSGRFYPPTAQIAIQQGRYLAKHFGEKLKTHRISTPFIYKTKGTICSLGDHFAIGMLGNFKITGKLAIWIKRLVEARWRKKFS